MEVASRQATPEALDRFRGILTITNPMARTKTTAELRGIAPSSGRSYAPFAPRLEDRSSQGRAEVPAELGLNLIAR